jgi:peptide/nickel transport system substrate-binding protein
MDRRQLLLSGVGAVAGAGALGALIRTPGALAAVHPTAASKSAAPIPQFVVAVVDIPSDLDPDGTAAGLQSTNCLWALTIDNLTENYLPLATPKESLKFGTKNLAAVRPKLAEHWEVSKDGLTWRFYLRKGVYSQYGNEMTSADVVWRGQRMAAIANPLFTGLLTTNGVMPQNLKAIDKYTVEIPVTAPTALMPQLVDKFGLAPLDSTEIMKHATSSDPWGHQWLKNNNAGYGPYKLASYNPTQGWTAELKADYWDKSNIPSVQTVVTTTVADPNERLQLVLSGQANIAAQLLPTQNQTIQQSSTAELIYFLSTSGAVRLFINTAQPPFDQLAVRQAIAQAITYDGIASYAYLNQAVSFRSHWPPWFPGATDKFWTYKNDPAAAKAGLAHVAGTTVKLSYLTGTAQPTAEVIQNNLNAAGLNVVLEPLTQAQFVARQTAGGSTLTLITTGTSVVSPLNDMLTYFTKEGSVYPLTNYDSPELDAVIAQLRTVTGKTGSNIGKAQTKLYNAAEKILTNDLPSIPLVYAGVPMGITKGLAVSGMDGAGGYLGYGGRYVYKTKS